MAAILDGPYREEAVEFVTAFMGEEVDAGRMEAKKFAPSLFAMASLVEHAAEVVYVGAPPVRVDINANFRRGSFEFDLQAITAVVGQHAAQVLTKEMIERLLKLIGLRPSKEPSALEIIQAHGDHAISVRDGVVDEHVTLSIQGDNNHITIIKNVPVDVARIVQNREVRSDFADVVEPLKSPGIDAMRIGPEKRPYHLIKKEDVPKFLPPPSPREELADSTSETAVEVLSPSFVDGNKWRVAQNGQQFWLAISDAEFLHRIDNGERFGKGDYLIVDMRVRAYRTDEGLMADREAVRVIKHIPREKQANLF